MGSLERFFGILIEHYAGAFPLWLAPVQLSVLTIAERHEEYARRFSSELRASDIRVELDLDNEKIGNKIRKSSIRKIPYSIIIGDKEVAEEKAALRRRNGESTDPLGLDELKSLLSEEINRRR
jgi:threonyl-tRNA synthetase